MMKQEVGRLASGFERPRLNIEGTMRASEENELLGFIKGSVPDMVIPQALS